LMGAVDTLHTSTNTLSVCWLAWVQVRLPSMWKLQQIQSVIDYITS
jgi:hypothetical protein